jgi:hypothetical protein
MANKELTSQQILVLNSSHDYQKRADYYSSFSILEQKKSLKLLFPYLNKLGPKKHENKKKSF